MFLIAIAGMVCQPLLVLILLGCLCPIPRALGEDEVEDDNGNYGSRKELSQNEERGNIRTTMKLPDSQTNNKLYTDNKSFLIGYKKKNFHFIIV